jgi:hypothetical protein
LSALAPLPALADEAPELPITAPGSTGLTIRYQYLGTLGNTGLTVEAMPTMLMVKSLAPGSPAALADVPSPERFRVRVAAVNERPVESYTLRELQQLFNPTRGEVTLTMARKGEKDLAETLVGPFTLPLVSRSIAEQRAVWMAGHQRFKEAQALLENRQADPGLLAEKSILAAQDAARGGEYAKAMALASSVPSDHELAAEAQRLTRLWRVAQADVVLSHADFLASQGQFTAALAALKGVPVEGTWQKLRASREVSWKDALDARVERVRLEKMAKVKKAAEEAKRREAERQAAAERRAAAERAAAEYRAARRAARLRRQRR